MVALAVRASGFLNEGYHNICQGNFRFLDHDS